MTNKDPFENLLDEWMVPEKIEDSGFSQRVLDSLEPRSRSPFSWNLIFLCLSLVTIFSYYRWDLILFRQYLLVIKFCLILSQVEISNFTISVNPSLLAALLGVVCYFLGSQFLKLAKSI